jgi:hypothetical protein
MIGVAVNTSIATGAPLGIADREAGATSKKGGTGATSHKGQWICQFLLCRPQR